MSILNLFPVPRYLRLPAFGLDLSDRSVKYAELVREGKIFSLGKYGEKTVPQGFVENGELKNKEGLISLLKELREEAGMKYVAAALPEEKVFLSTVQLPVLEPEEMAVALESQMEENVPLTPAEAIFDYEILPETEEKGHIDVNLAVAPKELAENYLAVLKEAGFQPVSFDLESRALARSLVLKGDNTCQMLVNLGKTNTTFVIVFKQRVGFVSTIKAAGKSIDEAIAKNLSVDLKEAERLKKEKGAVVSKEQDKLSFAILAVVSAIAEQLIRHISYWEGHKDEHGRPGEKIEKIVLSGGDSNIKGLADYFSYRANLPVFQGNPWINIASFDDYLPEIEFKDSLRYAIALGLALLGRISR